MYTWGTAKRGLLGLGKIQDKIVNIPTVGKPMCYALLEIIVGHWPFFDQFQHLTNHNLF